MFSFGFLGCARSAIGRAFSKPCVRFFHVFLCFVCCCPCCKVGVFLFSESTEKYLTNFFRFIFTLHLRSIIKVLTFVSDLKTHITNTKKFNIMTQAKSFQKVEGYKYGVGYKDGSGTLQMVTDGTVFIIGFDAFNLIDGEPCNYATFEFPTLQDCLDHAKKEGYL